MTARMRHRPLHRWLLWLFLAASAALIIWSVREGDGPYDDLATFTWSRTIERPAAYNRLPPYDAKYGWTCFHGHENRGRFAGVYVLDMPYWPAGDPGLGPRNP